LETIKDKQQVTVGYQAKSYLYFGIASIMLACNAIGERFLNDTDISDGLRMVFIAVSLVFYIASYVFSIKGFSVFSRACRLTETNDCYYLGRNLKILSFISLLVTLICEFLTIIFYILLRQYAGRMLTSDETVASQNIMIISGIVVIVMQICSLSSLYIIFFLKNRRLVSVKSFRDFSLFAGILLTVQLIIGIISRVFAISGQNISFLSDFSMILQIIKYLIMIIYFFFGRNLAQTNANFAKVENTDYDKSKSDAWLEN
jgi:hypothetical protein